MKHSLIAFIVFCLMTACDDSDLSGWNEAQKDTGTDSAGRRGDQGADTGGDGFGDTGDNDPDSGYGDIEPNAICTNGESGCWNGNVMQCGNRTWQLAQNCEDSGGWCRLDDGAHFCLFDTLPDSAAYDSAYIDTHPDTLFQSGTDLADTAIIFGFDSESDFLDYITLNDLNTRCEKYCDTLATCALETNEDLPLVTSIDWYNGPATCQNDCVIEMTQLQADAALSACNEAIYATAVCATALPCRELQLYFDGDEAVSKVFCGTWHQKQLDNCY